MGTPLNLHIPDDDDDDDDGDHICPVCDGECTCRNTHAPLTPGPLSMVQFSALHAASPSLVRSTIPSPPKHLPSLKIKLTVPQSMLGQRRPQPPHTQHLESSSLHPHPSHQLPAPNTKRRGRPPKSVPAPRHPAARSAAGPHPPHPLPIMKKSVTRPPAPPKPRSAQKKSAGPAKKRKRVLSTDSSDLSDLDNRHLLRHPNHVLDDDDDDDPAHSDQFPTFVSASALSSRASDSSASDGSGDLSTFEDSDSSIEAEEENFIRSEINDRARLRRQLLGDDGTMKRDSHNAWVIRPRKNSEGPSDVDMDVDTDATIDDDENDDEEQPEDAEETGGHAVGAGYVGLATSWSDDDDQESSFDADLFFANLSSSEPGNDASSSSSDDDGHGHDCDPSDLASAMEASIQDKLAFEVTESWDGQIIFTNGLKEGQGILDMAFEAHAAQYRETTPSLSQESDIEMSSDIDDGGYEEDAGEAEGDTTDEELVGEDDLPNERAMRLFNLPFSLSAINPLSTMSPGVSPAPRDRKPFLANMSSPKPADILSGRVFWDSDDHDEVEGIFSRSQSLGCRAGPRTGHFELVKETRQAIIDGSAKDIPSPHPRFRRRGPSLSSVDSLLQHHLLASLQSVSSTPTIQPLSPVAEDTGMAPPEMAAADIVDLNELLEASFLAPEPSDSQSFSTDNESSRKPGKNRWDLMSVGSFRQSREPVGAPDWSSDATVPKIQTDYQSMMKSSPLSAMLWSNKSAKPNKNRPRKMSLVISPVIFPIRDHRDGDRTPTNMPPPPPPHNHYNLPPHQQNHYPHKSRKELRRERKLKRKSFGPAHHQHQHHQHHNHHHHPNSKSRSTSSMQRNNFFMSSIPPLNL